MSYSRLTKLGHYLAAYTTVHPKNFLPYITYAAETSGDFQNKKVHKISLALSAHIIEKSGLPVTPKSVSLKISLARSILAAKIGPPLPKLVPH